MIEKTLKLYIRPDRDEEQGFKYFLLDPAFGYQWTQEADIEIGEVAVQFIIPEMLTDDDLRLKAIETLKKKQEAIKANAYKEIQGLQERIDKMMLLTHQPNVVATE